MGKKVGKSEYVADFSGDATAGNKQKNALATALDIRKFEIELYWKRAAYFWTFNAAALTGYFIIKRVAKGDVVEELLIVAALGFVFSVAWYFVNRGSKMWQRNWEAQVDILEDEVQGPLYKTAVNRYDYKFFDLTGPFPFSVSGINEILSLFLSLVWSALFVRAIFDVDCSNSKHMFSLLSSIVLVVVVVSLLGIKGRTRSTDSEIPISIRRRTYTESIER